MTLADFMPQPTILIVYLVFQRLSFESQKWAGSIHSGRRGSLNGVVPFVLLSEIFADIFKISVLLSLLWFAGWKAALGLYCAGFVFGLFWAASFGRIYGDNFLVSLTSTILLLPTALYLAYLLYQVYS